MYKINEIYKKYIEYIYSYNIFIYIFLFCVWLYQALVIFFSWPVSFWGNYLLFAFEENAL